jgi:hypothetical protein
MFRFLDRVEVEGASLARVVSLTRKRLAALAFLVSATAAAPALAGFLDFPLRGSDSKCTINYATHGAYTADSINSVLDHSMQINIPRNYYYPYGDLSDGGDNGKITAFNGESVSSGQTKNDDTCIGGTIFLHPDWDRSRRMTNDRGCGSGFTSYDEHPGYDYKADLGIPVYAAAGGTVISTICYLGNTGTGSCASWGALAINHGNG